MAAPPGPMGRATVSEEAEEEGEVEVGHGEPLQEVVVELREVAVSDQAEVVVVVVANQEVAVRQRDRADRLRRPRRRHRRADRAE